MVTQLDSFGMWLLHRKIRFTANNFFTVDLTLVYAVSVSIDLITFLYIIFVITFRSLEHWQVTC